MPSLLGITSNGKIGLGLVALAFIAFALVSSFVLPRRNPDFPGRRLGLYLVVAGLIFVAMIAAVVVFAKESEAEEDTAEVTETQPPTETETETTPSETGASAGDAAAGEAVFAEAGCDGCHTLEAAGASGNVGPNLDESKPDAALVEQRVRNGAGAMPSFEDQLDDQEIADVTAFVVESTGG